MNFGCYIDLNLECLEITEGQQCAVIQWAPGSRRWDLHDLFKHHTPNAQHSTTFQNTQNLNLSWNLLHMWEMRIAVGGYFSATIVVWGK